MLERFIREIGWSYVRRAAYLLAPGARPHYFTKAWSRETSPLDPPPANIKPAGTVPDFIFLPMNDWHTRLQRSHQLAMALAAAGHRCFYFSPQLGYEYPKPYLMDRASRVGVLEPGIYEIHVRIPSEHAFDRRLLTPSESRRVADAIATLRERFRIDDAVQVMSLPIWLDAACEARERHGFPVIYDCHDHLAGFERIGRDVVDREPAVFEACDMAVFSAEPLMSAAVDANEGLRSRSVLLRNAANTGNFEPGRTAHGFAAKNRRRVAGYFGALDRWFDTNSVAAAAEAHPDVDFVMIGGVHDRAIERLRRFPNVQFAGEMQYAELPRQLAGFDVGLIPFRVNDLTLATNPIKLYEYMTAGIPVVSSRLPEVERCGDMVYIANSPADFAAKVAAALDEDEPALRRRRTEFARRENWDARARTLVEHVSALIAARASVLRRHAHRPVLRRSGACDSSVRTAAPGSHVLDRRS